VPEERLAVPLQVSQEDIDGLALVMGGAARGAALL
jgi:hypothetical protein